MHSGKNGSIIDSYNTVVALAIHLANRGKKHGSIQYPEMRINPPMFGKCDG